MKRFNRCDSLDQAELVQRPPTQQPPLAQQGGRHLVRTARYTFPEYVDEPVGDEEQDFRSWDVDWVDEDLVATRSGRRVLA